MKQLPEKAVDHYQCDDQNKDRDLMGKSRQVPRPSHIIWFASTVLVV